ncbi:MAG: tape measure protein [Sinimarinibacterium flocculans]|uniref:tape measure protein n=1 Tax=Sinimarinibacterium flocculans TaxID=985250 RepID=UPI003C5A4707
MADRNLELALRIKAAIDGLGEIDKLSKEIEGLGGDASEVRGKAQALASELERLTRQKVVAETFKAASSAAQEAAGTLDQMRAKSGEAEATQRTLQQSLKLVSSTLQQTRDRIDELSSEASRNSITLKDQQARLDDVTRAAGAAAEASSRLAAQQAAAKAEVTQGERALSTSATSLRRAETATQSLEQRLQKAKDAQRDLTAQVIAADQPGASLIERHERATERVRGLERALEDARNRTAAAASEYANSATSLDAANRAYGEVSAAAAEADRTNEALQQQLRDSTAEFEQARAKVTDTAKALREAEKAERDLERAAKSDEAALAAQSRTVDQLRAEVARAETAFEEKTAALEQSRKAMQYAGVDANRLADEEKRIARETALAKAGVAELSTELKNQRAALQEAGNAAETKGKKVGVLSRILGAFRREASDTTQQTGLLGGAIGKLTGGLTALVAGFASLRTAWRTVVDLVQTGASFERFQKQLEGAFGSAAAGEAAFEWVKQFARNTPLQLQDTLDAVIKLKSFGLDPLDGTLQALVDQNERLGGGQERLNGLVLAVGQAWAKQKLQGEEVLQLVERGVPVYDLLQKALGKTTAEIQDLQQKGLLGRDAIKALIDEIGRSAQGAAIDQMRTFNGTVSNLKDNYTQFLAQIADAGVLDTFKREIADVSAGVAESGDTAVRVAGSIRLVFETLVFAAATLRSAWNVMTGTVKAGAAVIADAQALIARAMSAITFGDISRGFAEAADVLEIRARELRESAAGDLDDIAAAGDMMARSLRGSGEALGQVFGDVPPKAQAATDALDGTAGAAQGVAGAAGAAGTALGAELAGGASTASSALGDVTAKGFDAAGAIEKLIGSINATSPQALIDAATALRTLEADGNASALAIEQGLAAGIRKVSDEDLPKLLATARDVLGGINQETDEGKARFEQMSGIVEQIRTEAFARLGVDAEAVLTGIDDKARTLLDTFKALLADPAADPRLLTAGFRELFQVLDSPQELEALKASLQGVQIQGFDTAAAISEIDRRLKVLAATGSDTSGKLTEAFKAFGIQTRAELQEAARVAEEQFELVKRSGQATAEGLDRAFAQVAEAQIRAAAAGGDAAAATAAAMQRARASTDEQRAAVDQLIERYVAKGEAAAAAGGAAVSASQRTTQALGEELSAIDAVEAAYRRRTAARDGEAPYDPRAIRDQPTSGGIASAAAIDRRYRQLNADQRAEVDVLFEQLYEDYLRALRRRDSGLSASGALRPIEETRLQNDTRDLISRLLSGEQQPQPGRTQEITINLPGIGSARVSATPDQADALLDLLRELERQLAVAMPGG